MDKRTDGGPAFPSEHDETVISSSGHERIIRCFTEGLSLRDYFAAKAMVAVLIDFERVKILVKYALENGVSYRDEVAFQAYEMADAMLNAREIKPE